MYKLLLVIFMMISSFSFCQETYELFFIKKITVGKKVETHKYIEFEPTPEFLKEENITNRDTIAILSYINYKIMDTLTSLRIKKGLDTVFCFEPSYEDEYGYGEECIFDYCNRKQVPLMVLDVDYEIDSCECAISDIVNEITLHKEIMRRILSKRAKALDVCVLVDKKTNMFYIYISVKRLFQTSYYIGD